MAQANVAIASFEYYLSKRLAHMEAAGVSKDSITSLHERGLAITGELVRFRSLRQTLTASGDHSPQGLAKAVGEAAAKAAGEIKRHAHDAILKEDIRKTRDKIHAKATPDPMDRLYKLLVHQEIRRELEARGITAGDPVTADMAYRDAKSRKDFAAMEALEGWALGSPVSPELIAEGQEMRYGAADPINSQKLAELEAFESALAQTLQDAMIELKDVLPVDDPIARMAQGQSSASD